MSASSSSVTTSSAGSRWDVRRFPKGKTLFVTGADWIQLSKAGIDFIEAHANPDNKKHAALLKHLEESGGAIEGTDSRALFLRTHVLLIRCILELGASAIKSGLTDHSLVIEAVPRDLARFVSIQCEDGGEYADAARIQVDWLAYFGQTFREWASGHEGKRTKEKWEEGAARLLRLFESVTSNREQPRDLLFEVSMPFKKRGTEKLYSRGKAVATKTYVQV